MDFSYPPPIIFTLQADYGSDPYNFNNKEETNAIWGGRERRKRDTQLKSLRGKRKGTLKVPGQVVSHATVVISPGQMLLSNEAKNQRGNSDENTFIFF